MKKQCIENKSLTSAVPLNIIKNLNGTLIMPKGHIPSASGESFISQSANKSHKGGILRQDTFEQLERVVNNGSVIQKPNAYHD